jgi:hypothetical protein
MLIMRNACYLLSFSRGISVKWKTVYKVSFSVASKGRNVSIRQSLQSAYPIHTYDLFALKASAFIFIIDVIPEEWKTTIQLLKLNLLSLFFFPFCLKCVSSQVYYEYNQCRKYIIHFQQVLHKDKFTFLVYD